ncbi:MAG TPA: TerC/Alx family metal homeostasis membrane protein [Clostridiaceae bacterium]
MQKKELIRNLLVWVLLAIIFDLGILYFKGSEKALEFAGGYVIEQSLSLDNLFLFLMIFSSFKLSKSYQKRVLNYGIIGAIILRFIFIFLGVTIVNEFHFVLYIFGIILIISGLKIFAQKEEADVKDSKILKLINKCIPITHELEGQKFFVRRNKILYATPLFAILILIEASDIIFAIDSIPAIFSITTDTFIIYTSNIFAIITLRNLYFIIERLHSSFKYVKYGVAMILIFTGIKLSILFFKIEISIAFSILSIIAILAISILVSVVYNPKSAKGFTR